MSHKCHKWTPLGHPTLERQRRGFTSGKIDPPSLVAKETPKRRWWKLLAATQLPRSGWYAGFGAGSAFVRRPSWRRYTTATPSRVEADDDAVDVDVFFASGDADIVGIAVPDTPDAPTIAVADGDASDADEVGISDEVSPNFGLGRRLGLRWVGSRRRRRARRVRFGMRTRRCVSSEASW
jgi:hypothetical protein